MWVVQKQFLHKINLNSEVVYLTSLYRSHGISITNFIKDIETHIVLNRTINRHFIIGDIHIDILDLNANKCSNLNNFYQFGFKPN